MYYGMSGVGDTAEDLYKEALRQGKVTPAQFQRNCASYGITKEKYGTSWDDKCIGHEYTQKIGPVFGLGNGFFYQVANSPFFIPGAIGVAGLALYLVLR
jgi:hypothetical protein